MPFLRFTRDKRGYETTALMHAFRDGGRAQPRILYWFRGPIAAKVGRPAIDEAAIREIEQRHPELSFDWARILQTRAVSEPEPEQPGRRRRPAVRSRPEPQSAGGAPTEPVGQLPGERATPPPVEKAVTGRRARRRRGPRESNAVSDAETPAARAAESLEAPRSAAAEEAFSPEDLTRLRGRYAAVLARIDRAVPDAVAAAPLRAAAEALNPDTWVTREDVENALEHYENAYRALLDALAAYSRPRE